MGIFRISQIITAGRKNCHFCGRHWVRVLKRPAFFIFNLLERPVFMTAILLSVFISLSGCASGRTPSCCLIAPPNIILTGEKTSVERQIIGEYRELEKDAWIISSAKTNVQRGEGISRTAGGDEILLRAMKIRELHDANIRKYKDEGVIGEGKDGLISYRSLSKYEKDKELKEGLVTLIEEENKARKTIFERSLKSSGLEKPEEKDLMAFGSFFAEEQTSMAKKNDWIQEKSGEWVRKK